MTYFTPELLERFGSENEDVALAAQDELERRSEAYSRYLRTIEARLPGRMRELLNQFYLHDAKVISEPSLMVTDLDWLEHALRMGVPLGWRVFGTRERPIPCYWVPLQLDTPPHEVLVLQYRAVTIENAELHENLFDQCPNLEWRHDEIELIEDGPRVEYRHTILFSKGFEVALRFQDFDFATLRPIEAFGPLSAADCPSPVASSP